MRRNGCLTLNKTFVESERQKRCLVRAVPAKRLATRKLDLRSFRVAQGVGPTLTGFFKPMGLGIKDFDYVSCFSKDRRSSANTYELDWIGKKPHETFAFWFQLDLSPGYGIVVLFSTPKSQYTLIRAMRYTAEQDWLQGLLYSWCADVREEAEPESRGRRSSEGGEESGSGQSRKIAKSCPRPVSFKRQLPSFFKRSKGDQKVNEVQILTFTNRQILSNCIRVSLLIGFCS